MEAGPNQKSALNNLIKTYFLVSIPVFALFLIISILLSNWMIRPVEDNLKKQKQFVSDASHELKTPLTVITTNTGKMKGLVTGLLELAKSEEEENLKVSISLKKADNTAALSVSNTGEKIPFKELE